ncbi:MAG TPA: protein kinase [Pyrinomonadaceae bacterium]
MQQHEWEKVKEVFTVALEQPVAMRAQFLAELCGGDEALRGEVESLLAAHEEPKNLLDQHTIDLAAQLQQDGQKYLGKRFGPYSILREIGRGGMGAVFLAERADGEFQQQVALKIIRQSFADGELEKHFRRERQILASLNHPNIAKLLDGGVSDSGELFLAMEFIAGEPLIGFAENHQLTIEERLQLFLKVCRAVSFAHQNLIIHRDLKPSNILVSDEGEPRLLDFGLAKLSEPAATPGGMTNADRTETAFRAFTPAYAAPEQILGKSVTTVSDVFSLGVILYELLTNEKPFHFEGKSLEEIIKTVSGDEPSLPSRTIKSENPQSAIRQRQLRGDLDNITLKALQKDPARRYQSVAEFANDIERHLDHLPIAARPNTLSYRASRFYQRNKIAVSATALIIIALVAGLAISLRQYRNAQRENAKAEAVNDFLKKMLMTANPSSGLSGKKGYQTTITDILAEAEKRLESEELRNQPEVRADLRQVVGAGYFEQGNYVAGEKNLRQALAEQTQLYGTDSPKLLITEITLASLLFAKADYESAENIYGPKLSLLRTEFQKGKVDADFLVRSLSNYAVLQRARGDSVAAESLLRESLAISSKLSSQSPADSARGLLALILIDQGKFDEAESLQRAAVNKYRNSANNETPEFCSALTLLGIVLMEKGDLSGAETNLREAESIYRKLYSPNFIGLYDNLRLQAQVSYLAGNYADANTKINQVLENYRQNSNPKYISFATALTVQGLILNKLGRSTEAEKVLREAVKLREENLPDQHFMTALTRGALGECLTTQKRYDEAETLLVTSYTSLVKSQAVHNPRTLLAQRRLIELYQRWNKPELADKYRALPSSKP